MSASPRWKRKWLTCASSGNGCGIRFRRVSGQPTILESVVYLLPQLQHGARCDRPQYVFDAKRRELPLATLSDQLGEKRSKFETKDYRIYVLEVAVAASFGCGKNSAYGCKTK